MRVEGTPNRDRLISVTCQACRTPLYSLYLGDVIALPGGHLALLLQ